MQVCAAGGDKLHSSDAPETVQSSAECTRNAPLPSDAHVTESVTAGVRNPRSDDPPGMCGECGVRPVVWIGLCAAEECLRATDNAMCESCETRPASKWCNGCIVADYQAACGCAKCVVRDTNDDQTSGISGDTARDASHAPARGPGEAGTQRPSDATPTDEGYVDPSICNLGTVGCTKKHLEDGPCRVPAEDPTCLHDRHVSGPLDYCTQCGSIVPKAQPSANDDDPSPWQPLLDALIKAYYDCGGTPFDQSVMRFDLDRLARQAFDSGRQVRERATDQDEVQRLRDENEKLREVAQEAREVLGLCGQRQFGAPEDAEVKAIGKRLGFGALMYAASKGWRECLAEDGWPAGGEFMVGPCRATVERALRLLDDALKEGT